MTDIQYDEKLARTYDRDAASMYAPEVLDPTIEFLAALAGSGAALEFGVGTGRVALPLAARGIPVHGIDISEPMLEELRRKPGAEAVRATLGSFATTRVDGSYRLVYLVFNTVMNLTSQEAQIACFQNAADHLEPGGTFVIEVLVPRLWALTPGERVQPFDLGEHHVGFDEYTDFTKQILHSHHIRDDDGTFRRSAAPFRWVWPSELDLMARLAGMALRERFAGFERAPFTDESPAHVSVWEKAG